MNHTTNTPATGERLTRFLRSADLSQAGGVTLAITASADVTLHWDPVTDEPKGFSIAGRFCDLPLALQTALLS